MNHACYVFGVRRSHAVAVLLVALIGCEGDWAAPTGATVRKIATRAIPLAAGVALRSAAVKQNSAEILPKRQLAPPSSDNAVLNDACPPSMVLVEGNYCPTVEHRCLAWMDPPGPFRRCKSYDEHPLCFGKHHPLSFCIERFEHVAPGAKLPESHRSFNEAKRICASFGERVCTEMEWVFACEGEELRPYPYGFERDPSACNADRMDLAAGAHLIRDLRSPPGAYPRCISPFGVRDMAGNLEELVARDDRPNRPALKGGHWLPGRNQCRAKQTIHGPGYAGVETGFRCCASPRRD